MSEAGTRAVVALLATLALAATFVAGTIAAPLWNENHAAAGGLAHLLYAPLCHQIPERSFVVAGGGPMAVCARCTGLYVGGLAGLAWSLRRFLRGAPAPRARLLAIAALPVLIDVLAARVGSVGLGNLPRALTALPFGFLAALFLGSAIAELAASRPFPMRARAPVEVIDG
jgi:uncharacterized membrane protein